MNAPALLGVGRPGWPLAKSSVDQSRRPAALATLGQDVYYSSTLLLRIPIVNHVGSLPDVCLVALCCFCSAAYYPYPLI
jgi:hypothetical protein